MMAEETSQLAEIVSDDSEKDTNFWPVERLAALEIESKKNAAELGEISRSLGSGYPNGLKFRLENRNVIDPGHKHFPYDVVVTLTDGATPALNASLGSIFDLVAAGNRTIAVPTNPTSGKKIIIRHTASGAARTLALNTGAGGFRYGTDITGLTETGSGLTDYIGAIYNATDSYWDVVAYTKGV
jgi:hypothetical protein